jgi:hypothetical protein
MATIPQLSPNLKDWLQAVAWLGAAVGAILAAIKLRSEVRLGREQRERELRWKQAEAGKALNDEMLTDPTAWPALQMLDYDGLEFELPSKRRTSIDYPDLKFALNPDNSLTDEKQIYIRECFDSLFYYMAMLQHYISSTLILTDDVAFPLDYYVPLLAEFKGEVDAYVERYQLTRTKSFLERYSIWRDTATFSESDRARQ